MVKIQIILYIIASVADLAVTLLGVAWFGYGTELNPIARDILVTRGPLGLSAFKISGVCLVIVLVVILARDDRAWVRLMARLLLLLGALVAALGAWSWLPVLTSGVL